MIIIYILIMKLATERFHRLYNYVILIVCNTRIALCGTVNSVGLMFVSITTPMQTGQEYVLHLQVIRI